MAQPRIGHKILVDVPSTTANLGPGFDCLGAALDLNNRFSMRRIEGNGEKFDSRYGESTKDSSGI